MLVQQTLRFTGESCSSEVDSICINLKKQYLEKIHPSVLKMQGALFPLPNWNWLVNLETDNLQYLSWLLLVQTWGEVTPWSCVLSADSFVLYTLKHVRCDDMPLLTLEQCNCAQVSGPLNMLTVITFDFNWILNPTSLVDNYISSWMLNPICCTNER